MSIPEVAASPILTRMVKKVRRRLRLWALAEGIALATVGIVALLGASLAFDYVLDYSVEPPRELRAIVTLLVVGLIGAMLASWIVWRLMARVSTPSVALLIEREVPDLQDRLMTVVEAPVSPSEASSSLLGQSMRDAESTVSNLSVGGIFDRGLIVRRLILATFVALGGASFAIYQPIITGTWARRVFGMAEESYPRSVTLRIVDWEDMTKKAARGRDVEVNVEADESGVIPDRVSLRYRASSARLSSRQFMTRVGKNRFRFVFRGVLEDLEFRASGGDARTPRRRIEVVDEPVLTEASLVSTPPAYTNLVAQTQSLSASSVSIPAHSAATISLSSNKEIRLMEWVGGEHPPVLVREGPNRYWTEFTLVKDAHWRLQLEDSDGIALAEPFAIDLVARRDEAPKIQADPEGVSTAITRLATVPMRMAVNDEYGIGSIEFETTVDSSAPSRHDSGSQPSNVLSFEDRVEFSVVPLGLKPGQKMTLAVVARDNNTLTGPSEGHSESIQFEIVTPEDLLSRLTSREMLLRQRFEQVVNELRDISATLASIQTQLDDESEPGLASRRLNLDRALSVTRKDAGETSAIASGFSDIIDELVNNRAGNPTLLDRLRANVVDPMQRLTSTSFPEAVRLIQDLNQRLPKRGEEETLGTARAVMEDLVAECEQILAGMMKLESFNEVVLMLRGIMEEQEKLLDETEKRRKAKILDLLDE